MGFTQLFTGVLTILVTLGFMFSIDWRITLVVGLLTPLSIFVAKFIAQHTYSMFRVQSETRAEMTGLVEELVGRSSRQRRPGTGLHRTLYARLQELLADRNIDESRILTEAALFADKTAIDEETVRLHSHVAQYREILTLDEPIGRKLDFLTQELNREANTIGSKCQDARPDPPGGGAEVGNRKDPRTDPEHRMRFPCMKLINIGFGNLVNADRLIAAVSPESAPIKRIVQDARDKGAVIDATYGRRTQSCSSWTPTMWCFRRSAGTILGRTQEEAAP